MEKSEEDRLEITPIVQIGVVVKDLEKAVEYYTKHFGLGPWRRSVNEHLPFATVHGENVPYTVKLAFADMPPLQLELIEVTKGPSIQLEHLEAKGEGIHHIQYRVKDLEKEIVKYEKHGFKILQAMYDSKGGFAYMDTDKVGGVIFEIIGPSPSLAEKAK
jgi:catechol 2,3-dioxygenase-like lactoylglutathione lyase family enzyme